MFFILDSNNQQQEFPLAVGVQQAALRGSATRVGAGGAATAFASSLKA
jgi:hypothetical protein